MRLPAGVEPGAPCDRLLPTHAHNSITICSSSWWWTARASGLFGCIFIQKLQSVVFCGFFHHSSTSVCSPFRESMLEADPTPIAGDSNHPQASPPKELFGEIRTAVQAEVCSAMACLAQQSAAATSPWCLLTLKFH